LEKKGDFEFDVSETRWPRHESIVSLAATSGSAASGLFGAGAVVSVVCPS
jgi:hypothetical protein